MAADSAQGRRLFLFFGRRAPKRSGWDLTALLNAADPKAALVERHVWLVRLLEWLRQAPAPREEPGNARTGGEPR